MRQREPTYGFALTQSRTPLLHIRHDFEVP